MNLLNFIESHTHYKQFSKIMSLYGLINLFDHSGAFQTECLLNKYWPNEDEFVKSKLYKEALRIYELWLKGQ